MMLKLSTIALVSVLWFTTGHAEDVVQKITPPAPDRQANCGPMKAVDEALKGLGAHPLSAGLSQPGTVVELMVHDDGSWAIVEIYPTGIACVLRNGSDFAMSPDVFLYRRGPEV